MAGVQQKRIELQPFTLTSSWTSSNGQFVSQPTQAKVEFDVNVQLNAGATILGITANYATNTSKIKGMLTANGSGKRSTRSADGFTDSVITFELGTVLFDNKLRIAFSATGDKNTSGSETVSGFNGYIIVEYIDIEPASQPLRKSNGITPRPCGVYIHYKTEETVKEKKSKNKESKKSTKKNSKKKTTVHNLYVFDGVTQIQHNNTVSIEEEPDKKSDSKQKDAKDNSSPKYVNNAKNEPDKLIIDVIMSDIYSAGDVTEKDKLKGDAKDAMKGLKEFDEESRKQAKTSLYSRSSLMYQQLLSLKESRRAVNVITPQYIYTNMLVTGITANQNPDHQFGWEGQITFQGNGYIKVTKKAGSTGKTTAQAPSPSLLVTLGLKLKKND